MVWPIWANPILANPLWVVVVGVGGSVVLCCVFSNCLLCCCVLLCGHFGQPSTYLWDDDVGEVHVVRQGEGGEQGDPLMPLFALLCGATPCISCSLSEFEGGERLFAFLDDLYIVCKRHLWDHAGRRECGTEVGIARQLVPHCSAQPLPCLQLPSCGEETTHSPRINRG